MARYSQGARVRLAGFALGTPHIGDAEGAGLAPLVRFTLDSVASIRGMRPLFERDSWSKDPAANPDRGALLMYVLLCLAIFILIGLLT